PYCLKSFKLIKTTNTYSLIKCSCDVFPLIDNKILYLKKNLIKKKLLAKITNDELFLHLFAFSKRSSFLFRLKIINKLLKKLTTYQLIKILTWLGYNKNYSKYILERERLPSFYISLILSKLINKNLPIIDFGCGFGHYLKKLNKKELKIGIDKDFLSLYFNSNFSDKNSCFICFDFDGYNLPFKKNSINQFIFIDGLYSIKNHFAFFSNLKKILLKPYNGFITQILNINAKTFKTYHLCSPNNLKIILKKLRFNGFNIISSAKILVSLIDNKKEIIFDKKDINNPKVYNIIFTNKKIIKVDKKILKLFKKIGINYYQDNDLLDDLKKYKKNFL
ncbi:MAG: hypothetical protein ACK4FL_02635, partial [Microgenomates group bacterium]